MNGSVSRKQHGTKTAGVKVTRQQRTKGCAREVAQGMGKEDLRADRQESPYACGGGDLEWIERDRGRRWGVKQADDCLVLAR